MHWRTMYAGYMKLAPMSLAVTFNYKPPWIAKSWLLLSPLLITTFSKIKLAENHSISAISKESSISLVSKAKNVGKYGFRFLQLFLIFFPSLVLLPICLLPGLRKVWMKTFVWSIERAGVVWIKLFQYLSHRRDVIGQDLAEMFAHLREFSPQHSLKQTKAIFERAYGVDIQQYFEDFNKDPIASGSVSQVYSGKLHKQHVAIKIRHPKIEQNIERDIVIIFSISRMLSHISRVFEIPVNEQSLKNMLVEQIYFTKEQDNLIKFKKMFRNPDVEFPIPFEETTDEVLIMSYIDGKPITYYEEHANDLNKFIARLGASAFFEMLIQHNFVHADCHGGNIMVTVEENSKNFRSYASYYWRKVSNYLWNKGVRLMLDTKSLKQLCDEQSQEDLVLRKQLFALGKTVKVTLLDVGMVITLEKDKRQYFINFLSEVIQGHPSKCAEMIYHISKHAGVLLQDGQCPKYLDDLEIMFELIRQVDLKNLQGIDVLSGMLRVIRQHRMKLDGQFATLLTNMLVLEAIAKDLDPNINILRCAIPYLPYK